jgi:MFS family permease
VYPAYRLGVIREADTQHSSLGQSSKGRRFALYAGIGAVVWITAVAIAGASAWYVVTLLICGVALGTVDAAAPHGRAGIYLVVPALLLAWWTTPRGDNDGLWLLIFPLLAVLSALVAGCHRLGSWMGREVRGLRAAP